MATQFNYKLAYKDDNLNTEPTHQAALDILQQQFERMGGLNYFIGLAIREFMKYGVCIIVPNLSFKNKKLLDKDIALLPLVDRFRFLDPQNLLQIYFAEGTDLVNAIQYQSQPKAYYTADSSGNYSINNNGGSSVLLDLKRALGCVCQLDDTGEGIGRSFFKDIWGEWRVLNNMTTSFNTNLITVGEHSYQAIPNAAFEDREDLTANITAAVQSFIDAGGGTFISPYCTLQKIDAMDLSKYDAYYQNTSKEIARRKGLNIEILGSSSGASRNLAEYAQADAIIRCMNIVKQFCYQFSEGFIKTYFEQVFAPQFFSKSLVDTPHLIVELQDNQNMLVDNMKVDQNTAPTQTEELAAAENYIRNQPEANVTLDTDELNNVLVGINQQLSDFFVAQMRKYITSRVNEAVENPTQIANKRALSKQQESDFDAELSAILFAALFAALVREANTYNQIKDFRKATGLSPTEYAYKQANKLISSTAIKDFKRTQLSNFLVELDKTVLNERDFISTTIADNKEIGKMVLTQNLSNIKGRDFAKLAAIPTMLLFDIANKGFVDSVMKRGDIMVRSGILENMCAECQPFYGATYTKVGDDWIGEKEYRPLPDPYCLGGNRCRCFYTISNEGVDSG